MHDPLSATALYYMAVHMVLHTEKHMALSTILEMVVPATTEYKPCTNDIQRS